MKDLVCFSHLRWGFVFQRPNHLMARAARERRVFFIEEPVEGADEPRLDVSVDATGVMVVVPHLPGGGDWSTRALHALVTAHLAEQRCIDPIAWLYTPLSLPLASAVTPSLIVYDCMDELSAFLGAPPELVDRERDLLRQANLVFTGGQSLFESKRDRHPEVHAFPSSVDRAHFEKARSRPDDPADQRELPHPRVGFFGVIDERMDLPLLDRLCRECPDIHFVMVGPVVKIAPSSLPCHPNLHWLGKRSYDALPSYLAHWDVAFMPFALNESTRFISPTKTLEYLAAGKPVVSTAIRDVVRPYGEAGVVQIADESTFAAAIGRALEPASSAVTQLADAMVAATSWDATWERMRAFIDKASRPLESLSKTPLHEKEETCSTT